jgi:hypothetical protein
VIPNQIFMDMNKLVKHLRIRLTEAQFKKLADTLISEKTTKSSFIRELISSYKGKDEDKTKEQIINQKTKV